MINDITEKFGHVIGSFMMIHTFSFFTILLFASIIFSFFVFTGAWDLKPIQSLCNLIKILVFVCVLSLIIGSILQAHKEMKLRDSNSTKIETNV